MPTRLFRAGLAVVVCLIFAATLKAQSAAPAKRSPALVKVNASHCVKLPPEQRQWLDPEWQRFVPFVHSCTVAWHKSSPLYVLSVWADEFEATLPQDAPAETLPKPVIVSADGKILGRLPEGFPLDPPRTTDVVFTNWSGGFPHSIRIEITDPTVLGNHTVVLDWNSADHSFVRKSGRK